MLYSARVEQAIRAAALLHHSQQRKGAGPFPYVTHAFACSLIVADYTDDEHAFIAALLHDTLEDTEYTPEELREDFGDEVMRIVEAVSEPQDTDERTYSWRERKRAYAEKLKTASETALIVAAADKIHNMRTIVEDYYDEHKRFLRDFDGTLEDRMLMYQDISNTLNNRLTNDILSEFNHVYNEYKKFIIDVKATTEIDN